MNSTAKYVFWIIVLSVLSTVLAQNTPCSDKAENKDNSVSKQTPTTSVTGSASQPSTLLERGESPYALIDEYLGYLTPSERAQWCNTVLEKGLDKTLRELKMPVSFSYGHISGGCVHTPKGSVEYEDYPAYRRKRDATFFRLCGYANSFPLAGSNSMTASMPANQ